MRRDFFFRSLVIGSFESASAEVCPSMEGRKMQRLQNIRYKQMHR